MHDNKITKIHSNMTMLMASNKNKPIVDIGKQTDKLPNI